MVAACNHMWDMRGPPKFKSFVMVNFIFGSMEGIMQNVNPSKIGFVDDT